MSNKIHQFFRFFAFKIKHKPLQNVLYLRNAPRILFTPKTIISSMLLASFLSFQAHYTYKTSTLGDYNEIEVAKANEINEGEMKEIVVGPTNEDTIIVAKHDGQYYAVGSKCTHYGAPMVKGVLFEDKLYCPWHCAAFSIKTGTPEMGPVWDGLPVYEIREHLGALLVKIPKVLSKAKFPDLAKQSRTEYTRFVILGAGPAALSAAQTLRQSRYLGEIIMITNENDLPYDRTVLSKNPLGVQMDQILLRDQSFYTEYGIKVLKNTNVKYINIDKNELEIEGRDKIKYDKLLIATGARPKLPTISGGGLNNVFTLRKYEDAVKLREAVKNSKKLIIIGASFIGLETASAIKKELKDNIDIVVIEMQSVPLAHVLGKEVGNALKKLHEDNGIKFIFGRKLKSLEGGGEVHSVILDDGTILDADIVLLGTGIHPNSSLVAKSLRIANDGGIYTDVFLRSAGENIFAAGDVANFPYWYNGTRARIEHYNEAIKQGSIAALNMMDKKVPYDHIPFFWTRQWDKSLQYTGYAPDYDDVYIEGDLNSHSFIAYYSKNNLVTAVAAMNKSPIPMIINQAMELNILPTMDQFKSGKVNIDDIKKKILAKKGACRCKKDECCKADYMVVLKEQRETNTGKYNQLISELVELTNTKSKGKSANI